MELEIWKNKVRFYRLIRYTAVVVLPVLLAFYVLKFKEFNEYLVKLNPGHIIPLQVWVLTTKFFSYCLHILINFCILLAITNRWKYSCWFVYVSFAFLMLGAVMVFLDDKTAIPIPAPFITVCVKANKSLILLVLFIAGHFVRKTQSDT